MAISKEINFILLFLLSLIKGNSKGPADGCALNNIRVGLKNANFTSITVWVNMTCTAHSCKPSRTATKLNSNKCVVQYSRDRDMWYDYESLVYCIKSKEVVITGLTQNTFYYVGLKGCNACDEPGLESLPTSQEEQRYGPFSTRPDESHGFMLDIRQECCNTPVFVKWTIINFLKQIITEQQRSDYKKYGESFEPSGLLEWRHSHVKCARSNVSLPEHKNISFDKLAYELLVEPFAIYNFNIIIKQPVSHTTRFASITTNSYCNVDPETERPDVRVISSDFTTIYLNVALSCDKFKGPLFLNYKAVSINDSGVRSTTDYQKTPIELPLADHLAIKSLSPNSSYNIILRLSRSRDEKGDSFELDPIVANTTMDVLVDRVEGLEATSMGPDHISFRWLLPRDSKNIAEFYIWYRYLNQKASATNFTINLDESGCRLWKEFYCGNVTQNLVANKSYTLAILPIKCNTLNTSALKGAIHNAIGHKNYSTIDVNTIEGVPQEPLNLTAVWSSPDTLNISWHHPNCTNGKVQSFVIKVVMQYCENISELLNDSVYSITNYEPEYFRLFTVNITTGLTLLDVQICVNTVNSRHSSKCVPKSLQIQPPTPAKSRKKIRFEKQLLRVPLTEKSHFKSELFVYVSSFYNQSDLTRLSDEFVRSSSEMPRQQTYKETRELKISPEIKNRSYATFDHDMFKPGKNFSIAVFRINIMNDRRSVSWEHKFLSYHQNDPQPFSNALWTVLVLLLLIPALIYATYKYRRSLLFKIQCAMSYYSVADDFVTLTLDRSESELNTEVSYENCKGQHSRRVKVIQLASYVKDAIDSQELQRQHQLFPHAEVLMAKDPAFTCTFGTLQQNRNKNRYNNVLPFDHNLVTLSQTGYINANYIDGYNKKRAYIATQGPLPNTIDDFWRMIWENRVVSVVMMVNLHDGNKKNCEKYWPDFDQELDFNGIKVTLCADASYFTYNVREMRVCLDGHIRKVTQVHFTCWPPMGQPLFPQTLVSLAQKMLTLPYGSNSPILVHCAAGVGRTGTIILCDVNLRMAAAEGAVDLLGTLQRLREQRPNMVDNADQYKLAHLVVLASLTAWNTTIAYDNMQSTVEQILEDGLVKRQVEYLMESEWQDEAMKTGILAAARHVPFISEKNGVPDESRQVCLNQSKDGYINAIEVDGYKCPGKFIVMQHPLSTTLGDFWRLVAEQRCYFIVNLNYSDDTDEVFWPGVQEPLEFQGNVRVELLNSMSKEKLTVVKVRVCYELNVCEKATFLVKILNFRGWPREAATPDNLNNFVCFLIDSISIARKALPVIVTCFDGTTASGLYVVLWNLVEQLQMDKRCDVCQTVRTIRICRKQFVCTEEQLEEVYKALLVYLRGFNEYMELSF